MDRTDKILGFFIWTCFIACTIILYAQDKYELGILVLVIYYLQNMWSDIKSIKRKLDNQ